MSDETSIFFTLITGASSGIGKALANELARKGQNLFLVALPGNGLDNFAKELIKNFGVKVEYLTVDLTAPETPQLIYGHAIKRGLKIKILINNAGNGHVGKFEEMSQTKIEEMIHLNIRALTMLSLLFVKDMKTVEGAHILNVGSFGAYTPVAYKSVYLATKSYVYYFTRSLMQEYHTTKINFSVLMPGAVVTNGEVEERIKNAGFLGKFSSLTPEYVAKFTVKAMIKGRFSILPGYVNRAIFRISACLPSGILLYITRHIFNKTC